MEVAVTRFGWMLLAEAAMDLQGWFHGILNTLLLRSSSGRT